MYTAPRHPDYIARKRFALAVERAARLDAINGHPNNCGAYAADSVLYYNYRAAYARALAWKAHCNAEIVAQTHAAIIDAQIYIATLQVGHIWRGTLPEAYARYPHSNWLRMIWKATAQSCLNDVTVYARWDASNAITRIERRAPTWVFHDGRCMPHILAQAPKTRINARFMGGHDPIYDMRADCLNWALIASWTI